MNVYDRYKTLYISVYIYTYIRHRCHIVHSLFMTINPYDLCPLELGTTSDIVIPYVELH